MNKEKLSQKNGFTLAEVLITLGIIGVVAALTIPTLVQSYKKKVVETKLAKFYSTMAQATRLSEIDNGPIAQWEFFKPTSPDNTEYEYDVGYAPEDIYNKYYKPYIKDIKTEVEPEKKALRVYFQDGSIMNFGVSAVTYYINEKALKSTSFGTDKFAFYYHPQYSSKPYYRYHYAKGIEPYAFNWAGTVENLKTSKNYGCSLTAQIPSRGAYCTMLIKLNGWKIPDDYPFKF